MTFHCTTTDCPDATAKLASEDLAPDGDSEDESVVEDETPAILSTARSCVTTDGADSETRQPDRLQAVSTTGRQAIPVGSAHALLFKVWDAVMRRATKDKRLRDTAMSGIKLTPSTRAPIAAHTPHGWPFLAHRSIPARHLPAPSRRPRHFYAIPGRGRRRSRQQRL